MGIEMSSLCKGKASSTHPTQSIERKCRQEGRSCDLFVCLARMILDKRNIVISSDLILKPLNNEWAERKLGSSPSRKWAKLPTPSSIECLIATT